MGCTSRTGIIYNKTVTVYLDDPAITSIDNVRQDANIIVEGDVKVEGEIGKSITVKVKTRSVTLAGIEPTSKEPESSILSIKLQSHVFPSQKYEIILSFAPKIVYLTHSITLKYQCDTNYGCKDR